MRIQQGGGVARRRDSKEEGCKAKRWQQAAQNTSLLIFYQNTMRYTTCKELRNMLGTVGWTSCDLVKAHKAFSLGCEKCSSTFPREQ